jgi:hypothetical protein
LTSSMSMINIHICGLLAAFRALVILV